LHVLIIGRALAGGASGVLNGCIFAIVGDQFSADKRGRATAAVMTGFSLATVVGVPASIWLAQAHGWRWVFSGLGGLGLAICVLIALGVKLKAAPEERLSFRETAKALVAPGPLHALALTVFLGLSGFAVLPFVSSYVVQNLGVANESLVQIYVVGGLASLVIAGLVGFVADKFGVEKIFPPYAFLVIIPCFYVTVMTTHSLSEITFVAAIFMGGIAGRIVGSMTLLNAVIREDLRAGFFSLNICCQQLAMGVASMLTGWLLVKRADGGFDHFDRAGYLAIVFGLGAVFASYRLVRQLPSRRESESLPKV